MKRCQTWQITQLFGGAEFLRYPDDTNVWIIFYCAVSPGLPWPLQSSRKDSFSEFWTQPCGAHFIRSSTQLPVRREVSGFRSICFLICLLWSFQCLEWDWTWVRFQADDLNWNPSLSVHGQTQDYIEILSVGRTVPLKVAHYRKTGIVPQTNKVKHLIVILERHRSEK